AEEGEQTLAAGGQRVRVSRPVWPADTEWELVMVTRDHESRRGQLREVRALEPREGLRGERCQIVAAPSRCGEQHAGGDSSVGQILGAARLWVLHAQAEQNARSLPAERVAGYGDTTRVEPSLQTGDRRGQVLEVVQHSLGILDAE